MTTATERAFTELLEEVGATQAVPIPLGAPNASDPPCPGPTTTSGWAAGDAGAADARSAFELATDEPDGSVTIVVSARRPAHPNWVCAAGHRGGRIWFRWFGPGHTPEQPQVEMPVATV